MRERKLLLNMSDSYNLAPKIKYKKHGHIPYICSPVLIQIYTNIQNTDDTFKSPQVSAYPLSSDSLSWRYSMCHFYYFNLGIFPVETTLHFPEWILYPNHLWSSFLSKGREGRAGFSGLPGPIVSVREWEIKFILDADHRAESILLTCFLLAGRDGKIWRERTWRRTWY